MSNNKTESTTHWLVTIRVNLEGKTKSIGSVVLPFPVVYDRAHVKLLCLASAINCGMKHFVRVGKLTKEQLGTFIQDNLLLRVKPLTRCKSWKEYAGKRKRSCDCGYCTELFAVNQKAVPEL